MKNRRMMEKSVKKLLSNHQQLTHSEQVKVVSHVQRQQDDWYYNTLMIENIDVPFKYKRKKLYKSLNGALVNLTYYPDSETIAGFELEVMSVVRVKTA